MPIIIKNEEKNYLQETTGLKIESLTDSQKLKSPVMVVNRLIFDSNIIGPEVTHTDIDQLLYVIKGNGIAKVNNEELSLNKESILWLENGEKYQFISGSNGLEILQGYVPDSMQEDVQTI
jgi:mannose-6-phosphate isomerase-like protein (cupin superfamily)|tara:strand:- start:1041 stop:1400 length:360 start_codon:yes stop_codon:yes gene_type:complete